MNWFDPDRLACVSVCIIGDLEQVKMFYSCGKKYFGMVSAAAEYGHLEIVRFLLENGQYTLSENSLAICDAAWKNHTAIVQLLLEYGTDPKAQNNRPLIHACRNGNLKLVQILLEAGAEQNFQTSRRLNPEIKDLLARWKYRVDGPEYQQRKELIQNYSVKFEIKI